MYLTSKQRIKIWRLKKNLHQSNSKQWKKLFLFSTVEYSNENFVMNDPDHTQLFSFCFEIYYISYSFISLFDIS